MIGDITTEAKSKMEHAVEFAKEEFSAIRTGRAHPSMFNRLVADYYGSPTPIQQLASYHVPEARMILITPYDRAALNAVEKAIRDSDLGVNPSNDGNTIRCVLPELTAERRREYTKLAKTKAEDAKISVRNARRAAKEAIDKLVKDKEIGEDEGKRAESELDKTTRKFTDHIDEILKAKEAELLEV